MLLCQVVVVRFPLWAKTARGDNRALEIFKISCLSNYPQCRNYEVLPGVMKFSRIFFDVQRIECRVPAVLPNPGDLGQQMVVDEDSTLDRATEASQPCI